jgi:hypothetical protein
VGYDPAAALRRGAEFQMPPILADIIWGTTSGAAWIMIIGLALACIFLSIWIYNQHARAIPRVWWSIMLILRIAALLAICFILLKPTAVRSEQADAKTPIAILIDRSASMSALDTGDPPAQQIAIAAALKIFPPSWRDDHFLKLQQKVEPLIALLDDTRRALAERQYARLMNNSAQSSTADFSSRWQKALDLPGDEPLVSPLKNLSDGIDQPNWPEQAQKNIEAVLSNLSAAQRTSDNRLFEQNAAVREACAKLSTLTRFDRARAAIQPFISDLPSTTPIYAALFNSSLTPISLRDHGVPTWPTIQPSGDQSDISGAIQQLLARMDGTRLGALLVLTDGRQIGGSLAANLPANAPPIFPILCAGTPRDLVLENLTAPTQAYLDEPLDITAQVRGINLSTLSLQAVLHSENSTLIQNFELPSSGLAHLHFHIFLSRPGPQTFTLAIPPIPGEATSANNQITFRITVQPTRLNLALLSSFPNRDFQFLQQQLSRTSWINSRVILPSDSITTAELQKQQVIIINDLAARQLNSQQWRAIRAATEQGRAGLILIAGGNHLPGDYLADGNLAALLPFAPSAGQPVWRTWAGADAFFRFTPADLESSLLRLEDEPGDITPQWDRLPAMYHYLQIPQLKAQARVLLSERESGSPVLTEMSLGQGHTFFLGFNETWRWRGQSVELYHRFWQNLIRHAAPLSAQVQQSVVSAELSNLLPDASSLSRLAGSSTQKVYSLNDTANLLQSIQQYQKTHPASIEYGLWHSIRLFGFILGCLGAEWALRKRFGLA